MRNLQQVGFVQDYLDALDELYQKAGIREDQALNFFLCGLIDVLQMPVQMFPLMTLAEAYALAKLQDIAIAAMSDQSKSFKTSQLGPAYRSARNPPTTTIAIVKSSPQAGLLPTPNIPKLQNQIPPKDNRSLTSKEFDERRAKGLCFWCNEKYTFGHKCKQKQLYTLELQADTGDEEELPMETKGDKEREGPSLMQLSVQALNGAVGPRIMRLEGSYGKWSLFILVDFGSTHNFLS